MGCECNQGWCRIRPQVVIGGDAQSWSLKSLGALADHSLMVLTVSFL